MDLAQKGKPDAIYLERKFLYTSQKTSFRLSLREFNSFSNTFLYESILIKFYMNANIMNTQIFYLTEYDLKGH